MSALSNIDEERVIFFAPGESRLKRQIKNGIKRTLMVIVSPFTTYEEISLEPEFIGPSILILLSILFSFLDRYSLFMCTYYFRANLTEISGPNVTTIEGYFVVNYVSNQTVTLSEVKLLSSLTVLMNSISPLLLMTLFGLAMRLIPLCLISYLLTSIMKGMTRGILPGICYTLSPLVVQQAVNIILKRVYLSSLKGVIVILPKDISFARDEKLILNAINLWLTTQTSYLQIASLINWFFMLWQLVLLVALFMGIGKFGAVKAIALTIVAYVLVSIALMPMYTTILGS